MKRKFSVGKSKKLFRFCNLGLEINLDKYYHKCTRTKKNIKLNKVLDNTFSKSTILPTLSQKPEITTFSYPYKKQPKQIKSPSKRTIAQL